LDRNNAYQFWVRDGVVQKLQALSQLPLYGFPGKGGFEFYDHQNRKLAKLIVPVTFPNIDERPFNEYIYQDVKEPVLDTIIVLIQAGEACIGRVVGDELITHKLIRKYMVRKSQGKSQIKHLNSKGKSRAGSRIRLAQTVRFFEEINECLTLWFNDQKPHRVAYHVPANMSSLWYTSKVPPPFEKGASLLRKTFWDIQKPRREEIIRSMRLMNCARITIFDPVFKELIIPILEKDN